MLNTQFTRNDTKRAALAGPRAVFFMFSRFYATVFAFP